ncbi:TetR/AcrR family transcriptional regulator [Rhodococcus sp. NPDC058521]|uniref:TetR/AcrR family transcriptional regulator n=1 Tax=Rhodococcus sp. NPDC058521 TaxID=3346536 RepID=UPI0036580A93
MSEQDPRKARSRTRLLDAATALLAKGGTDAVTIDAVTKAASVARATLYRHFGSGNELLAAAFGRLLPPAPEVPEEGNVRTRLLELLVSQAALIENAPIKVTAMCWVGMGPSLDGFSLDSPPPEYGTLRETIAEQYRVAFDKVLRTPEARAEWGDFDYDLVVAQLIGPIVFTRLATLTPLGRAACEQLVDDFVAARKVALRAGKNSEDGALDAG